MEKLKQFFKSKPYILGLVGLIGLFGLLGLYTVNTLGARTAASVTIPITEETAKAADTQVATSSNYINNFSFENTPYDNLWTTSTPNNNALLTVTSTASNGVQAALCTSTSTDGSCLISQYKTGFAPDDPIDVSFDVRGSSNTSVSSSVNVILTNSTSTFFNTTTGNLEGFTECFDVDSQRWNTATSTAEGACTISLLVGDSYNTSTYSNVSFQGSGIRLSAPYNGIFNVVFAPTGNVGDTVMIDNVNLIVIAHSVAATPIEPVFLRNTSDFSRIDSSDKVCLSQFSGGTSTCAFWITGDGKIATNNANTCTEFNLYSGVTSTATCW